MMTIVVLPLAKTDAEYPEPAGTLAAPQPCKSPPVGLAAPGGVEHP